MKKLNDLQLEGKYGKIKIKIDDAGVPEIICSSKADAAYGLGYMHAVDRQLQLFLTRSILQGRASEHFADEPALVELDIYMRKMNWFPDVESEIEKLDPMVKEQLECYADAVNYVVENSKQPFEFRLLKYVPEPWSIQDTMLLAKIFGFLGLAEAQGSMEKLIVQMVQNGVEDEKIKELFPYLTEELDRDLMLKIKLDPPLIPDAVQWFAILPKFRASNNWVVSGNLTSTGSPILCGDPHLEVNRTPALWYEAVIKTPDNELMGATLPGTPGIIFGRGRHVAWSPTYSFMDMLDYRVEECREGKYRRGRKWLPFMVKDEIVKTKKGRTVEVRIYENEHGVLEGDPEKDGFYLVRSWSSARNCGAGELNGMLSFGDSKSVRDMIKKIYMLDAASFNFAIADTDGNIGLQMSGRMFNRPKGVSGLVPLPGWDRNYDNRGFADKKKLPGQYNPSDGIIVTANEDINHLGRLKPINLPMGKYRSDRIKDLLQKRANLDTEYMKKIQYDLYSLQAEKLMRLLTPYIPDSNEGRILKEWNYVYDKESSGATAFENVYMALLKTVFGDGGFGRQAVTYLLEETSIFNDYYANFDEIMLKKESNWFGTNPKESLIISAMQEGLSKKIVPYGKTRMILLSHLLFGGKLPSFLGFDNGPIPLPGSRATVTQGQMFKTGGRTTTFSPSYRMIADMSRKYILTNMPGGQSDRRLSPYYRSDLINWIDGNYKQLKCTEL